MRSFFKIAAVMFVLYLSKGAYAQDFAIKTNLLYDATASANLGIEAPLGKRLSLDISGNYNPWTWKDNTKWKHWLVQPELRIWPCRQFAGSFFAIHALAGQFNFGNLDNNIKLFGTDFSTLGNLRHQGWAFGAGLAYGYALPLGKHWNLEFEAGVGAIYSISDSFECDICARPVDSGLHKLRPALTKAALNLVYLF